MMKVPHTFTWNGNKWEGRGPFNAVEIGNASLENRMFKNNEITPNKIDFEDNSILSGIDCVLGTINSQTGNMIQSTKVMATTDFVIVKKDDYVELLDKNFLYCPFLYDENNNYLSSVGAWINGKYTFTIDCKVKFTCKTTDTSPSISNHLKNISKILSIPNQSKKIVTNKTQIKEKTIEKEHLNFEMIDDFESNSFDGDYLKNDSVTLNKLNLDNSVFSGVTCRVGTINSQTGEYTGAATGMAMNTFVDVKKGDYAELLDKNFLYCPFFYDENEKFLSSRGIWFSDKIIFDGNYKVKFTVKFIDGSENIKNELNNIYKILTMPNNNVNLITEPSQIKNRIIKKEHLDFDINSFTISHLYGKKWANLGDSITARDWYQQLIVKKYGINSENFGLSGSTVTRNADYSVKSFVERMTTLPDDLDYLTIWGGVNDFGFGHYGYKLGSDLGSFDSRNDTDFYGALHILFDYVIKKYKKRGTRIGYIITTPVSDYQGNKKPNSKGHTLDDYCQAVREVCEFYSIPFLDLQKNSGINQLNVDVMTSNVEGNATDGLHPSKIWFEMKQYSIVEFMLSL